MITYQVSQNIKGMWKLSKWVKNVNNLISPPLIQDILHQNVEYKSNKEKIEVLRKVYFLEPKPVNIDDIS